jgi:hypothetical protein
MTTTPAVTPRTALAGRVTLPRLLISEWIKLRTLRSTWWGLGATAVVTALIGWLVCLAQAHQFHNDEHVRGPNGAFAIHFIPNAAQLSLTGIHLSQLIIGTLGVLVVTGEYSTRMVLATLSATPRRLPVLVAKGAVFSAIAIVVCEIANVIAFELGQAALKSTGQQATWDTVGTPRAVFGAGLYLLLIGLFGVGLGFVLRSTAAAISTLMGLVLVLPLIATALPHPYNTDIGKFLPMLAGTQIIVTPYRDPDFLTPWIGLGVLALWVAAALGAGAYVLHRRDA